MLENKSNSAIGRVNAILVLNIEGQEKAVVTPLIVRADETPSNNEHRFNGVCSFSEKTKDHLLKTVFPIVESILEKLQQPQKFFKMSISNIGATSLHDIGINASGFSADAAACVAAASAGFDIPGDVEGGPGWKFSRHDPVWRGPGDYRSGPEPGTSRPLQA